MRVAVIGKAGSEKSTLIENINREGITCIKSTVEALSTESFDAVIVVSSSKYLHDVEHPFVDAALKTKKPFYFVRTHIDADIRAAKRRGISQQETTSTLAEFYENQFAGATNSIYFVGFEDDVSIQLGYGFKIFIKDNSYLARSVQQ